MRARHIPALACAYFILEWLSEAHELNGLAVTAWNPGLGVVFAAMARAPAVGAGALFLGVVAAEFLVVGSALGAGEILALAAIETACFTTAALVMRWRGLDTAIGRARDLALLLAAGLAAAAADTLAASALLLALGRMGWADLSGAAVPFFVGDAIGILIVAPLALRLAVRAALPPPREMPREVAVLAAALAVVFLLLALILRGGDAAALQYLYVLVLPLLGAALLAGLDGACLALAGAQLMLVGLMHAAGFGPDAFSATQAEMLVLAAAGLFAGALATERDAARGRVVSLEATMIRADRLSLASAMGSALSHELTQPLTAARALARASVLRLQGANPVDSAMLAANLERVVGHVDLAHAILTRMRDFVARGEPAREAVALAEILAATEALVGPRAAAAGMRLVVEAPSGLWLACDKVQIQQVLLNLIGNAIEARQPDHAGCIALKVWETPADRRVVFAVADDGRGLDAARAATAFTPLVSNRAPGEAAGLGLGLSICALIVEAHGGRIWLESHAPGATEFRFWLPGGDGQDAKPGS